MRALPPLATPSCLGSWLLAGGWLLAGCLYVYDGDELDAKAAGAPVTQAEPVLTVALETPAIELPDGGTTNDACAATAAEARAILTRNCASCHAPPAAMGGFRSVLDVPALLTLVSGIAKDPVTGEPMRFLFPGAPQRSRLYRRAAQGEMPPRQDSALAPLNRPSTSDISVLRAWIENCLEEPAADPVPVPAAAE